MHLLLLTSIFAFSSAIGSAHPNFPIRNGTESIAVTDRGTLKFPCKGIEDACNNVCYDIRCRNGDRIFMRKKENSNINNRYESGCTADSGPSGSASPCLINLFRRQFVWGRMNEDYGPVQCDEWPPNAFEQKAFDAGRHRNSLRSAGREITKFLTSKGDFPGRTGDGPIQQGETFAIDWDTSEPGTDTGRTYYCDRNHDDPDLCKEDGLEFHMTKKVTKTGRLNDPYDYSKDNRYAFGKTDTDIQQCEVWVHRLSYDGTTQGDAVLKDMNGKELDVKRGRAHQDAKLKLSKGLKAPLEVTFHDATVNSVVSFNVDGLEWESNDEVGGENWCERHFTNDGSASNFVCKFGCFRD